MRAARHLRATEREALKFYLWSLENPEHKKFNFGITTQLVMVVYKPDMIFMSGWS